MADVFDEVDGQIRSARFQSVVSRGWPYAAGLVVIASVVALAAYGLNQRELSLAGAASEHYADAMQVLDRGDLKGADNRFADLARSGPRIYRSLALMQQAGIRLKENNAAAATPLLDQAAELAPNLATADSARLQAAYIVMDGGDYAQIRGRLVPLAAAGRPYRMMAREALGMAELASGRLAEARGDLEVVSLSADSSDQAHNRAAAALGLLRSGDWSSISTLARASASLKAEPPPVAQPGALPSGASAPVQSQPAPQAGAAL